MIMTFTFDLVSFLICISSGHTRQKDTPYLRHKLIKDTTLPEGLLQSHNDEKKKKRFRV